MANTGPSELLLLFVVALLVLGPERLPKVASQVGRWVRRARRVADQLRRQLEREISLSEAKGETPADLPRSEVPTSNHVPSNSGAVRSVLQRHEPPSDATEGHHPQDVPGEPARSGR